MTTPVYTTKNGAVWVFPDGPGEEGFYLGCIDSGDLTEPLGDSALIQCFDENGDYKTVGETKTPPGAITVDLTQLTASQRSYLEKLRSEFGLIFLQRDGDRADLFSNWKRATILNGCELTSKTLQNIALRETDNPSTRMFSISAEQPLIEVVDIDGKRILEASDLAAEVQGIRDVHMLPDDCGILAGKYGVIVPGGATPEPYYTQDGGHTWIQCAALTTPCETCAIIDMGNGAFRLLVGSFTPAGATGEVYYSDDWGATWTTVLFDASNACNVTALFARDKTHIWLADTNAANQEIYFSNDGGASWTRVYTAALTGTIVSIWVAENGDGAALTDDGEFLTFQHNIWSYISTFASALGSGVYTKDGLDIWVAENSYDHLAHSIDGGVTWTTVSVPISSATEFTYLIQFVNDWVGFCSTFDTAFAGKNHSKLYRTIDGGVSWEALTTDASNFDYLAMWAVDENYIVAVGDEDLTPVTWVDLYEED